MFDLLTAGGKQSYQGCLTGCALMEKQNRIECVKMEINTACFFYLIKKIKCVFIYKSKYKQNAIFSCCNSK